MSESPFSKVPQTEWIASNALAFAIWDKYPVGFGHALVITKRVVSTWFDATPQEQSAVLQLPDRAGPDDCRRVTAKGDRSGSCVFRLQRRWWSNESCVATGADIGFSPTNLGFFDPNTGEESYQTSLGGTDYCMLREPRRFHGTCSNGATCNAGGECVSGPAPEVRMISTPLPSP